MAVHFADLHDTPGRMEAKGVIRRQVQWKESRAYFYWRLRRRLWEFQCYNKYTNSYSNDMNKQSNVNSTAVSTTTAVATSTATTAAVKLTKKEFSIQLKEMFLTVYQSTTKTTTTAATDGTDGTSQWENDKWLINWLEDNNNANQLKIEQLLQNYYHNEVATHMAALLSNLTAPTTTNTNDNTNDNEIGLEKVLKLALEKLPIESRAKVLETLKKL